MTAPDEAEPVRLGLDRVMSDTPVRTGYLQLLGSVSEDAGLTGRLEAGYRPLENLGAFAYGELSSKFGASAGAGIRLTF